MFSTSFRFFFQYLPCQASGRRVCYLLCFRIGNEKKLSWTALLLCEKEKTETSGAARQRRTKAAGRFHSIIVQLFWEKGPLWTKCEAKGRFPWLDPVFTAGYLAGVVQLCPHRAWRLSAGEETRVHVWCVMRRNYTFMCDQEGQRACDGTVKRTQNLMQAGLGQHPQQGEPLCIALHKKCSSTGWTQLLVFLSPKKPVSDCSWVSSPFCHCTWVWAYN